MYVSERIFCFTEKPKQLSKTQSQMRDAISVDEGGGGTGGGGSNSEGGKRTESVSEDNTSQGIPAPDSNLDEVVSDSSDSDDDNDADDDDNEEARRRRQFKAEKV